MSQKWLFHDYIILFKLKIEPNHWSISCVFRLSLLGKGFESLSSISCPKDSFVVESLDLESRFEVCLYSPVNCFLSVLNGNGSIGKHFLHNFECLLLGLCKTANHMVHQSYFEGIFSLNPPSCEDELFGQGNSDCPGKSLRSSSSGNQTPVGLRQSHFGLKGGNSYVCVKGKL